MKKLPRSAKHGLWAFAIFLVLILACRHIVSDQQQETRIEMLETQVAQLERLMEAHSEKMTELQQSSSAKGNCVSEQTATASKPAGKRATQQTRQPAAKATSNETSSKTEQLAEKLTDDHKSHKFREPVRLELNTVDSATLVKVPGIAERTASTIIAYRQRLGGFYSPEQLREKLTWDAAQEHMDDWCTNWFFADESLMQMLRVNHLSFKEINRHPYISYEQTKALVNYRDKHKGIRSISELEQLEAFDDETIGKLKHYLSFE